MNTRSWLEQLVAFDTTSRNSNLALIETARDYLKGQGVQAWLAHNAEQSKANLFATLPAADGGVEGGVVLSGHTDVVPVDGQDWSSDPFKLVEKNGALQGRGACDMKGFIASSLALVPEFLAMPRKKPIHLAFSYDEEVGCVGAPLMIADLMKRGIKPEGCIVGEPTSMRPVVGHKGINVYRCHVHGHAVHSSLTPQGVNAIEYAARLICHIRDIADRHRAQGPYDEAFTVPFTTAQTGTISGGVAVNIVPALCEFTFQVRNLPTVDVDRIVAQIQAYAQDELVPRMKAENPAGDIRFTKVAVAPALDESEQDAVTALVRALTSDQSRRKVAYGTEAGLFKAAGIPSIICGPGDIEQAHKPDEYVELEQLRECEKFLSRFIRGLSLPA